MTDKLAEAIAFMDALHTPYSGHMSVIMDAARAYHDLLVVDAEEFKMEDENNWGYSTGYNDCIKDLKRNYPQGLKWK